MTKAFNKIAAGLADAIPYAQDDATKGRVGVSPDGKAIRAKAKLGQAKIPTKLHVPATSTTALSPESLHVAVRRVARSLLANGPLDRHERLKKIRELLSSNDSRLFPAGSAERYYFASALYMLLMPPRRRQQLAAYFTPPHLCQHVIGRLEKHGLRSTHTVLDPACGGAAFLVPLIEKAAQDFRREGICESEIRQRICSQFVGYEIEPGLAELSATLVESALAQDSSQDGQAPKIIRGNALRTQPPNAFDAVVGNPPYGRVFRPSQDVLTRWSPVISDGHVNTYALFIALSLEQVREGGLIALIVPTSFIGGPFFKNLRTYIREQSQILELNLIEKRSDEFIDVVQDTCVLVLRKCGRNTPKNEIEPACHLITPDGEFVELGNLELSEDVELPWALPSATDQSYLFRKSHSVLSDYGYQAKTGYFVWNRTPYLLSNGEKPRQNEFPLVWAKHVRANEDIRIGVRNKLIKSPLSFVTMPPESTAIQRRTAIVLQRTTSKTQPKRLIAGIIPQSVLDEYQGFVTENHTILVSPIEQTEQRLSLHQMMNLLNSQAVDQAYRRVSGTVSVSVKVLESLPLPPVSELLKRLTAGDDMETAASAAYASAPISG